MAFHEHLQHEIAYQRFTEEEDEERVPWINNNNNSVNARQQNFMHLEPERSEKSMDRNRSENNCTETEELREYKAEILGHPLYDQLLSAHVSCLRIATPVDQLPRIDAQLQQSQRVLQKYSSVGIGNMDPKELDHFMVCSLNPFFNHYSSKPQLVTVILQKNYVMLLLKKINDKNN
jgi:hypothetical protein